MCILMAVLFGITSLIIMPLCAMHRASLDGTSQEKKLLLLSKKNRYDNYQEDHNGDEKKVPLFCDNSNHSKDVYDEINATYDPEELAKKIIKKHSIKCAKVALTRRLSDIQINNKKQYTQIVQSTANVIESKENAESLQVMNKLIEEVKRTKDEKKPNSMFAYCCFVFE